MKLKELKNSEQNILDFITFFDDIADTNPYFIELVNKYGERELLNKIEEMFNDSGLGGIGMIFDLKINDWKHLETLTRKLVEDGTGETTITKTTDRKDTVDKTGSNSNDVKDNDFVVAYDVTVDTKQSGTTKTDVRENTEKMTNEVTGTDTTTKTGYDENRMKYIMNIFKSYPNYRLEIYSNIVDNLCIKGYN